jgi:hypothetical protein
MISVVTNRLRMTLPYNLSYSVGLKREQRASDPRVQLPNMTLGAVTAELNERLLGSR